MKKLVGKIKVVNGWVKGTWQRGFKKNLVLIEKETFEELSAAVKEEFEAAAQWFIGFVRGSF